MKSRSYNPVGRNRNALMAMAFNLAEPLMKNCKIAWQLHVKDNFETEGGEVGGWKPLHYKTKALRMSLGYKPFPIMNMTGMLKSSWAVETSFRGSDYEIELKFDRIVSFSGQDLATKQHYGGKGLNIVTKERFTHPARKLFSEQKLERYFRVFVEEPFQERFAQLIKQVISGGYE